MSREPERTRDRGFTLVELMIVIAVIAIIAAIAIPNMIEARKSGNETSAVGSLKAVLTSQVLFREKDPDNDGPDFAGSMSQLGAVSFIDPTLAAGSKSGYNFTTGVGTGDPSGLYWATANPVVPGVSGGRYFALDMSGVIFYTQTGPITPDPATAVVPPGNIPLGK